MGVNANNKAIINSDDLMCFVNSVFASNSAFKRILNLEKETTSRRRSSVRSMIWKMWFNKLSFIFFIFKVLNYIKMLNIYEFNVENIHHVIS